MDESWDDTASIIIPTYYRNELLRDSIESALAQTYSPIEVIVVDDSGEAHAESTVKQYESVTYVPLEENVGENPARDAGLDVATGRYVQFLDDDDVLREDKISKQVSKLDDATGVVYSGLRYYESGEVVLPNPDIRGDVLEDALRFDMWPPCFTSALLIDRRFLEPLRPIQYHGAGDTTIMIDLAKRTHFDYVDLPLVKKRLEVDNLGASRKNIENKRKLLEIHRELYDSFPESVRRASLSDIYRIEGLQQMDSKFWSLGAIIAFSKAAYYTPDDRFDHTSTLVASLFGKLGLEVRQAVLGPVWRKHW